MMRPIISANYESDFIEEESERHHSTKQSEDVFIKMVASLEGVTSEKHKALHSLKKSIEENGVPRMIWGNGLLYQPELALLHSSLFSKINEFGDLENLAMVLYHYSISSKNGDNTEELNHLITRMLDSYQNMLTTFGVVGALIASVVYPYAFESTPGDLSEYSIEYFGPNTTLCLFYVFYSLVCTSIVLSLSVVLETVMNYKHVAFWLCKVDSKLKYMQKVSLAGIVIKCWILVIVVALTVPFGAAALLSPVSSLIATVSMGFLLILLNGAYLNEVRAMEMLLEEVASLVHDLRSSSDDDKLEQRGNRRTSSSNADARGKS